MPSAAVLAVLLSAVAGPEWVVQRLDATSQGRVDAGPAVVLELPETGRILSERVVPAEGAPGRYVRFTARVTTPGLQGAGGETNANPYDWNLDAAECCLVIEQRNAQGQALSASPSQALLGGQEGTLLAAATYLQPGAASLALQCRAIGVKGSARFEDMDLVYPDPPPLKDNADLEIARNGRGGLLWTLDGEPALMGIYFGNNQFERDDVILDEMAKAVEAGVEVVSFNLFLPCLVSTTTIDDVLARFLEPFPEARFIVRVWMGLSPSWYQAHPEELLTYADGETIQRASPASALWRETATQNLRWLVEHIRRSPYGGRLAGVIPMYYQTGEWIVTNPERPAGYNPRVREAFAAHLLATYGSLAGINDRFGADYDDPGAIPVPSMQDRRASGLGYFRHPQRQGLSTAFSRFYSGLIPGTLRNIASAASEASRPPALTGYFYGYTFETAWNDVWPQQSGHLGLGALLQMDKKLLVGSPYSYNFDNRAIGKPADIHGPMDSPPLRGVPVFFEEDTYTHIAEPPGEGLMAPGYQHRSTNLRETLNLLKRNLGLCAARGYVVHWQNLLSDGRFNLPAIWDFYEEQFEWLRRLERVRGPYRPDVAVVVDEGAVALLRTDARPILGRWLYELRSAIARVDAAAGYYLQSDLANLPDSVRCVILLTPYRLTELPAKVTSGDRMVVFCYMPGLYAADETLAERPGSATGIRLALHRGDIQPSAYVADSGLWARWAGERIDGSVDRAHLNWNAEARHGPVSPYFTVEDPAAEVLARYEEGGPVSCALKRRDGWTSVFLGAHVLEPQLWRALFREAGAHLYLETLHDDWQSPDVVEANERFLMIQAGRDGVRTVRLPRAYDEIRVLGGGGETVARGADAFAWAFTRHTPVCFQLGPWPD